MAKLPYVPRTILCKSLNSNRSSGYYHPTKLATDKPWLEQIISILKDNPSYGIRRIRLAFKLQGVNMAESKIRRICRSNNLFVKSRKAKPPIRDKGLIPSQVPNLVKDLYDQETGQSLIRQPDQVWAGDFSYFSIQGSWYYLATVLDVFTKEILGFSLSQAHDTKLITRALNMALNQDGTDKLNFKPKGNLNLKPKGKRRPRIFHSDQGSEYASGEYQNLLANLNIQQSHSDKASPWQNGCQESFYGKFKNELDLRQLASCRNYMEVFNLLASHMEYYNHRRIHTTIENIPSQFYAQFLTLSGENNLSRKLGG